MNTFGNYMFVLKMNWGINLPSANETIYYKDNISSFNGDGEKFSILKYKSNKKIKKLNNIKWDFQKDRDMEDKIKQVLNTLVIDKEYAIDFNKEYLYYTSKEADSSELFIIYIKQEHLLYIIENLL